MSLFFYCSTPNTPPNDETMAAHLTPEMMRSMTNSRFIQMARDIYAARSDPAAPPPTGFNDALVDNLIPDLQAFVATYSPVSSYVAQPDPYIDLTIVPDISLLDGSLLERVSRDGANGNSLRALAMAYKPSASTLRLNVGPGMSHAMYNFYGESHLEIGTEGPVPIHVNMFHQDVTSLSITSTNNQDILLDSVIDRMTTHDSLNYHFGLTGRGYNRSSLRAASSPVALRRMMRTFVQTGLTVMESSNSMTLKISVSFYLPFGAERDDDDAHGHLANRAGQAQNINYGRVSATESVLDKPADQNIPTRTLNYSCSDNVVRLTIVTS